MANFPRQQALLFTFIKAVVAYLTNAANNTRLGISAAHQAAMTAALNPYTTAYNKYADEMNATKTDLLNRNNTEAAIKDAINKAYGDIPDNALTDVDRATLNIAKRNPRTPAPTPTSHPVLTVDTSQRLQHTGFLVDSVMPGKAKPKGVKGAEIWSFIGGTSAPADMKLYRMVALCTSSHCVIPFDVADAGKPVWYITRWRNARGEFGPWSVVVMATVGG